MKTKNLIIVFVLAGILISLFYIFNGNQTTQSYIDEINKERKDKDEFMQNAEESPFANAKDPFEGLKYFSPDIKFRIQASLNYIQKRETFTLVTNIGDAQSYLTYAWAEFDLDNLHNRLLILEVTQPGPEQGKLFLAFADQTSANETYGAGRYLDIKKVPGANSLTLDFNKAYNPYTEKFVCPFPPKENLLKAGIKAGEKVYK
jgi:uncharacterized protein (DUF1684 family)